MDQHTDFTQRAHLRNEFSAVTLRVLDYGRGARLEVRSTLYGTTALLDATVLEALSRMDQKTLANLVGVGLAEWDDRQDKEFHG